MVGPAGVELTLLEVGWTLLKLPGGGLNLGGWSEPPTSSTIPEISRWLPANFISPMFTNELISFSKATFPGSHPSQVHLLPLSSGLHVDYIY